MLRTLPYTQVYVGTFEVFVLAQMRLAHLIVAIMNTPSWQVPRQFLPPPVVKVGQKCRGDAKMK